jgi:hypothetical protein
VGSDGDEWVLRVCPRVEFKLYGMDPKGSQHDRLAQLLCDVAKGKRWEGPRYHGIDLNFSKES